MIPSIAVLHFENERWHMPRLWIPLILLWIPVILVLILISPLLFIGICAISMTTGVSPLRVMRIFWDILSSLRGTDVRVTSNCNKVLVRIL